METDTEKAEAVRTVLPRSHSPCWLTDIRRGGYSLFLTGRRLMVEQLRSANAADHAVLVQVSITWSSTEPPCGPHTNFAFVGLILLSPNGKKGIRTRDTPDAGIRARPLFLPGECRRFFFKRLFPSAVSSQRPCSPHADRHQLHCPCLRRCCPERKVRTWGLAQASCPPLPARRVRCTPGRCPAQYRWPARPFT